MRAKVCAHFWDHRTKKFKGLILKARDRERRWPLSQYVPAKLPMMVRSGTSPGVPVETERDAPIWKCLGALCDRSIRHGAAGEPSVHLVTCCLHGSPQRSLPADRLGTAIPGGTLSPRDHDQLRVTTQGVSLKQKPHWANRPQTAGSYCWIAVAGEASSEDRSYPTRRFQAGRIS